MPTQASVRALGETDLNPVSGLGKISQLVFAVVQPSNVVANLIAGGASLATLEFFGQFVDLFKGWQKLVHNSKLAELHLERSLTACASAGLVI